MFEKWSKLCFKIGHLNDYTYTATCVLNIFWFVLQHNALLTKNTHIFT